MMLLIRRMFAERVFRYLFAGGCTTLVNFGIYTALTRIAGLNENIANIIAVCVSVLFAYVINKIFVFRSKTESNRALLREFVAFVGARGFTIGVDVGGLYVLHTLLGVNDLIVKAGLTILIIVLNYIISRFWVFE